MVASNGKSQISSYLLNLCFMLCNDEVEKESREVEISNFGTSV